MTLNTSENGQKMPKTRFMFGRVLVFGFSFKTKQARVIYLNIHCVP